MNLKNKYIRVAFLAVLPLLINRCGGSVSSGALGGALSTPVPTLFPESSGPCQNQPIGATSDGEIGTIDRPECNSGDEGTFDQRTPANLVVNPPGFDFQLQSLNSLNYARFVITNLGQKPATNLQAVGLGLPYTFRNGSYPGLGGTCIDTLPGATSYRCGDFSASHVEPVPLKFLCCLFTDQFIHSGSCSLEWCCHRYRDTESH